MVEKIFRRFVSFVSFCDCFGCGSAALGPLRRRASLAVFPEAPGPTGMYRAESSRSAVKLAETISEDFRGQPAERAEHADQPAKHANH